MGDDTRKDRLVAAAACLVLAGLLGGLAVWLGIGVGAGERDYERFSTGAHAMNVRAQSDVAVFTIMLMVLSGVLGTAALGLLGLAMWMVVARQT